MNGRRVVVTGMAGITSLGSDWTSIEANFSANRSGIRRMAEWDRFTELNTRLAGPVDDFSVPPHWTRKQLRSMGRVSRLSVLAAERALADAGLLEDASIRDGRMGVACGSSTGSTEEIKAFGNMLLNSVADGLNANSYIRMMPHTTAANISIFFGLTGRVIPTSSACTSGSQGIGYAYEAIKFGRLTLMLAGGAEELCATEAMVFDALYATSLKNDAPHTSPRPYDSGRDGLVIGEGAGMLVLEELEHALARGATIHAELVGFGSNADGQHATKPEQLTMRRAMELALEDAGLAPAAIGYREWPRHCDRTGRHRRNPGDPGAVRQRHADQLAEVLSRSHPGCVWRAGILVQHRDDEPRPLYPHAQPGRGRPALRRSRLPAGCAAHHAARVRDE